MSLPEVPLDSKPPDRPEHVASVLLKVALELTPRWGRSLAFLSVITVAGLIAAGMARTDVQALAIIGTVLFVDIVGLIVAHLGID